MQDPYGLKEEEDVATLAWRNLQREEEANDTFKSFSDELTTKTLTQVDQQEVIELGEADPDDSRLDHFVDAWKNQDFGKDFSNLTAEEYYKDLKLNLIAGREGVEESINSVTGWVDYLTGSEIPKFEIEEGKGTLGEAPKLIGSMAVFFGVGGAIMKAANLGTKMNFLTRSAGLPKLAPSMGLLADSIAFDMGGTLTFDTSEIPNLMSLANEVDWLEPIIPDIMTTNPLDGKLESYIKHAAGDSVGIFGAAVVFKKIFGMFVRSAEKQNPEFFKDVEPYINTELSNKLEGRIEEGMLGLQEMKKDLRAAQELGDDGLIKEAATNLDDATIRLDQLVEAQIGVVEGVTTKTLLQEAEALHLTPNPSTKLVATAEDAKKAAKEKSVFSSEAARKANKLIGPDFILNDFDQVMLGIVAEPAVVRLFKAGKITANEAILRGRSTANISSGYVQTLMPRVNAAVDDWITGNRRGLIPLAGRKASPKINTTTDAATSQLTSIGIGAEALHTILDRIGKDRGDFLKALRYSVVVTQKTHRGIPNVLENAPDFMPLLTKLETDPVWMQARDKFNELTGAMLQSRVIAGGTSAEAAARMRKQYTNPSTGRYEWFPLSVAPSEIKQVGHKVKGGGLGLKQKTGNVNLALVDAEEDITRHMLTFIRASETNRMKQTVYTTLKNAAEEGGSRGELANKIAVRVTSPKNLPKAEQDQIRSFLSSKLTDMQKIGDIHNPIYTSFKEKGKNVADMKMDEMMDVIGSLGRVDIGTGAYDVVHFSGKAELWRVNDVALKEVFDGLGMNVLEGINKTGFFHNETLDRAFSVSRGFNTFQARSLSTFGIPLHIYNSARGELLTTLNSPYFHVPVLSTLRSIPDVILGTKFYHQMMDHGLSRTNAMSMLGKEADVWKPTTDAGMQLKKSGLALIAKHGDNLMHWFSESLGVIETSQRLATARIATRHGLDPHEAATMALNVGTNFSLRGGSEALRSFSRHSLFLNPSFRGAATTYKMLKYNWKKTLPLMVSGAIGWSAYDSFLEDNWKEEFDAVNKNLSVAFVPVPNFAEEGAFTEWAKTGFTTAPPALDKDTPFFQLAVSHEGGATMHLIKSVIDTGVSGEKRYLLNSMSRVATYLGISLLPSIAKGPVGVSTNRNTFGTPIVPDRERENKVFRGTNTGEMAVLLSKWSADITDTLSAFEADGVPLASPATIDYVMDSILVGASAVAKNAMDDFARDQLGEGRGERETTRKGAQGKSGNILTYSKEQINAALYIGPSQLKNYQGVYYDLARNVSFLSKLEVSLAGEGLLKELSKQRNELGGKEATLANTSAYFNGVADYLNGGKAYRKHIKLNEAGRSGEEQSRLLAELDAEERQTLSAIFRNIEATADQDVQQLIARMKQ